LKIVGILFAMALAVSLVLVPAAVLAQDCPCSTKGDCPTVTGTGGAANCEWDPYPKWWTNPTSHDLYLNHWGRTPIQAMSRLAGLCASATLCTQVGTSCPGTQATEASRIYGDPNACWPGGCPSCRDEEGCCLACCDSQATCAECNSPGSCEIMGAGTCPVSGGTPCACDATPVFTSELPHCGGCWGVSLAFASKSWSAATITPDASKSLSDTHLNHFGTCACYGGNHGGDWGLSGCPHTECCTLTWCLQDNCFSSGNCN
jgi:hypothetical protein